MSQFEYLPNETIYKICQDLDTPSLIKLSESYSRVYQVCSEIIEQRRKEYPIDSLMIKIKKGYVITFEHQTVGGTSEVKVSRPWFSDKVSVIQTDEGVIFPSIIDKSRIVENRIHVIVGEYPLDDSELKKLLTNIHNYGYQVKFIH